MGRATIDDIARRAGVSTATVDRALNARAGVRPANRQRVLEAARDLGYLPSAGTVILPSHPAHLHFLIPFGHNEFMAEVSRAISHFAADLPLVASCTITELGGIGAEALISALDRLPLSTDGIGVITTDRPAIRAALDRLCTAGIPVVTIASDVPGTQRAAYVGVRNRAAGRTAARMVGMLAGPSPGSVGLFLGSHDFHGHREREAGFRESLARVAPHLKLIEAIETGEDGGRTQRAAAALRRSHADLRAVYCIGAGRAGIVRAFADLGPAIRPRTVIHDLTPASRKWLASGRIDAVIDQNARLIGEQSLIRLLGAIASPTPLLPMAKIEPAIVLAENLPDAPS